MPKMAPGANARDASVEDTDDGSIPITHEKVESVPNLTVSQLQKTFGQTNRTAARDNMFGSLEEDTDYFNWLMYGPEGSGKTTAACRASRYGKILVIRAEGGLKKIALEAQGCNVANIAVYPRNQGDRVTCEGLEAVHEQVLADLRTDPGSWFAVVLDSVTEIHITLREDATDKRVAKVYKKLTDPAKLADFDPDFVDRDDYGVMTNQLRKLVRKFRDLPCHVVLTGLIKVDDQTQENVPNISPAIRNDILGYVDVVTAHKADDDIFRALTRRSGRTRAKDRFGLLPKVWAEPDFPRLMQYLTGELTADADPIQIAFDAEQAAAAEKLAADLAAKEAAKAALKTTGRKAAPKKTTDDTTSAQ